MATDLDLFRATVSRRKPERILCYASFTPDLQKRVIAHAGTEDLGKHYGMFDRGGVAIRRPVELPAPDYSSYWKGENLRNKSGLQDLVSQRRKYQRDYR